MIGIAALIFFAFLLLLYLYLTRKFDHWKNKNVPYLKPVPLFGNFLKTFTLQKNIGEALKEIYLGTANPFFGFFICDKPCLLICDPELIKQVFVKDFHIFANRNTTQNLKADPIGSNILPLLKGQVWKDMRKKITPVFSSAKIKAMYPLLSKAGTDLINYLKNQKGTNVDAREAIAKYSTDSIASAAFGIHANCFKDENCEFIQVTRRVLNFAIPERAISTACYFIAPALVKLFGLRFIDKKSSDFLRDNFWKAMNEREEKKFVRNDLLDILIELRRAGDFEDFDKYDDKIVAQAVTFFLGGSETTSSVTSLALFELALHPEIQSKLRDEIIGTKKKHEEDFTYDSIQGMEYLDMCVKETLRKYPIAPFLDRTSNADYILPGTKVTLEKNTPIFISVLGLHHNEKYWPKPDEFDPTRFTEENVKSRPPFTYLPFGEGPRNCVGARYALLSSKLVLSLILSEFEIELVDRKQRTIEFIKKGILLASEKPILLKFKNVLKT